MPGGLTQIVTYGSQDLYLTGTPEITFFKTVYRRHTNFSMESINVPFDDPVGFNKKSSLIVPKIGDIIHNTYLEVLLPEIDIKRFDISDDLQLVLEKAEDDYLIVTDFMSINRSAYVRALDIFLAQNTSGSERIIQEVNDTFNEQGSQAIIDDFRNLLASTDNAPFLYDEVSMQSIISRFTGADDKNLIFKAMTIGIDRSIKTQNYYFTILRDTRLRLEDELNENIKFAWVEKVGHAIIDDIELNIGGQKIDRQFGDWMNIWYELSGDRDTQDAYNKLIGNVKILTEFNREKKPQYRLKVPLQFWFNRYSGLALPLIALEYHDVMFEVKFRKIEEVSYVEDNKMIRVPDTDEGLFLDELSEQTGINISASMFIDYIYLDSHERRRFAQSSHEYLIDQVQVLEIEDVTQANLQCVLNKFFHPSKEMIWVAQKVKYVNNIDGYTKLRWDNYSLTDDNRGNPIKFSQLDFHSYVRIPRLDGNYFNYAQPLQHHNATPSDGINMYSFSLFPEENQPSGSANFNQLARATLKLEFDESLLLEDGSIEPLNVRIYVRNTNILRFISGMAGLAFTYG